MTTVSVAEARAHFSRLVDSAATTHERFDVTKNGGRAAVLLGADDYDSLVETLEILGSRDELAAIKQGLDELDTGDVFTVEEVRAALKNRG